MVTHSASFFSGKPESGSTHESKRVLGVYLQEDWSKIRWNDPSASFSDDDYGSLQWWGISETPLHFVYPSTGSQGTGLSPYFHTQLVRFFLTLTNFEPYSRFFIDGSIPPPLPNILGQWHPHLKPHWCKITIHQPQGFSIFILTCRSPLKALPSLLPWCNSK